MAHINNGMQCHVAIKKSEVAHYPNGKLPKFCQPEKTKQKP